MIFILYLIKDCALFADWFLIAKFFLEGNVRIRKKAFAFSGFLLAADAAAAQLMLSNGVEEDTMDIITDIISFLLYIALLFSSFQIKKKTVVLLPLFCYNFITEMLYSIAAPYMTQSFEARLIFYDILYTLVALAILILMKTVLYEPMPNIFKTTPKWIFVAVLLFCLACYYRQFGVAAAWYNVIYSFSAVMMLLCIFFFIVNTVKNTAKLSEVYRHMNELSDYCDTLARNDEELRAFRHDYRNHMQVVSLLLKKGCIADAERYIRDMQGSTVSFFKKYSTGNIVLDSILSNKAVSAAEQDAEIVFHGYFPGEGVENNDVCTIAANLLDNAVRACGELDGHKEIRVESDFADGNLVFSVANPTAVSLPDGAELKTTKADKRNHGYGIKNVKKTVGKYDGMMDIETENREFRVTIVMKVVKTAEPISV